MFFIFLYSFILTVPLVVSVSSSHLCLTFSQNSLKLILSNSHPSILPLPARLNPYRHRPPKLDVTDPPTNPLIQNLKRTISLKPTPLIRLKPLPPIHFFFADPFQVSCLCLLHLHAWDFLFGYVCVSINIK